MTVDHACVCSRCVWGGREGEGEGEEGVGQGERRTRNAWASGRRGGRRRRGRGRGHTADEGGGYRRSESCDGVPRVGGAGKGVPTGELARLAAGWVTSTAVTREGDGQGAEKRERREGVRVSLCPAWKVRSLLPLPLWSSRHRGYSLERTKNSPPSLSAPRRHGTSRSCLVIHAHAHRRGYTGTHTHAHLHKHIHAHVSSTHPRRSKRATPNEERWRNVGW